MQISNIDASLSQGNLLDKKQFTVLYIGVIVCLIIPLITIVMLCISQIEWDGQTTFVIVGGDVLSISFLTVLVFTKIKNDKLKKKLAFWIEDAVEVIAYSKQVGENRLGIQPKAIKIQVKFTVDNKTCIRESTAKAFGGQKGYLGVYKKYANREIHILYSQKHDEVLILKEKTIQKY